MLVTFSCEAYADITMFGDIAKSMLTMMGHSATVPGAILADDVPSALARLQDALEVQENLPETDSSSQDEEDEDDVSLAHRALPLVELLEAAASRHCDVMWS